MNTVYISLGAQCTTKILFNKLHINKETLPFDNMFTTPNFIYTILKLLIVDNMDVDSITNYHFYNCDARATLLHTEHHSIDNNGPVFINKTYNVAFPHEPLDDIPTTITKYTRRLERLKNILLNKDIFIHFVYISISSKQSGNYTINGEEPIQDVYLYISKINDLLKTVRENFKITIFDTTNMPKPETIPDTNISYYPIQAQNNWACLLPELESTFGRIITTDSH